MGVIVPKRFDPIRFLRKDRASSTFVATDQRLGRNEVVVKVIGKGNFAGDTAGLLDVLTWYRGLRHPYISEILDAGLTPRQDLFYVRAWHSPSELFAGADKDSLKTLVSGVDFLHSRGRVHGAIRPSNIFAAGGVTRLSDPWVGQKRPLTEEDVRFTAPETLTGGSPGMEGDLYSLGAVLYRFFSGRDPFVDSDLASLKAKYIWAYPRPLVSVSHVSRPIGDIVTNLIHKDPSRRKPAFEALKEELDVQPTAATHAPSIGLTAEVEETLKFLLERSKLRVVLVEGPAGSGKSRLVEELQSHAGFRSPDRAIAVCSVSTPGPYATLARRVVSLIDEQNLSAGTPSLVRLRSFLETEMEPMSRVEQEQLDRDLISLIASSGRQARLLLMIEDIDRGNRRLLKLLEQIAQHASELELAILMTSRPGGVPSRTAGVLTDFLGDNFHHQTLGLLSQPDAEAISQFLATDQDRRAYAVAKSGGNPSFLEAYCTNTPQSVIPKQVRKTLSSMIARLPKQARRSAEVLSLFEEPIGWDVLSRIAETPDAELRESVADLDQIGMVDGQNLSIRYPDAASLLQSKISKVRRTELHARCFHCLQEAGSEDRILARHAFCGGLFDTAGTLYLGLARDNFGAKDFGTAAHFYGLVSECHVKLGESWQLDCADQIKLARCYGHQGKPGRARTILNQILKSGTAGELPALLSSVYVTLASNLVEHSAQERIRLLQLAVNCLPADSPELLQLYPVLALAFLTAGDLPASERTLKAAKLRSNSHDVLGQLEVVRASVLMQRGNFKDAARCLSGSRFPWATPGIISTNLAVCLEQLGDVMRARDLQMSALRKGESIGSLVVQVMSLGNLGSMESKLGNFGAAERFFGLAVGKLQVLQRQEESSGHDFGIIYADAALHSIQRGDFRKAIDYLNKVSPKCTGRFLLDVFLIVLTRCELYLALGRLETAQGLLDSTKSLPLNGDFIEIERLVIESRLRDPSVELCNRLEVALRTSRHLGTLYQECRVLLALATVHFSLNDFERANATARAARRIARRNRYRLLAARASLLMGLSAKRDSEKHFDLNRSLDEAAEIGLTPMVAECSYHIGAWRYNRGDYAGAQDFLSKSVSITARLAEDLGAADRKRYLSLQDHRKARALLDDAAARGAVLRFRVPELLGEDSALFMRLYRLAASMTAAADLASAVTTLVETLKQLADDSAIVFLETGSETIFRHVGSNPSEESRKRALKIAETAGDKAYITGLGTNGGRNIAVWMPLLCLALRGGIYVECLPGRPGLNEREIEFLTIAAAIAGAAFDRVCSKLSIRGISSSSEFCGIVGASTAVKEVRAQIEIAATNAATVLIEGESGTGKELVAKAIHQRSSRANALFIPVDCGALPEGLMEAELFGAKKGAYTGAMSDRLGLFEAADRGTIFLDEISNLGLAAQAKLLRVLQEREVRMLGSMIGRVVDVRIISATNCNLDRLAREGKFRQDLLYRLKVLHVFLPPLRDRKSDIPVLATTFLERLNTTNQTKRYFGPGVLEKLLENDFPGNVRELQNAVERGFYSTSGPVIKRIDFARQESSSDDREDTQSWFKDLTEGKKDFWSAIHDRYKRRDIPRERVVALIDIGLRAAHGNYKALASMFQIPRKDYRRFMDFLRRNQCLLDFRPYRSAEPV